MTRFRTELAPRAQIDRDEPIAGRTVEKVEAAGKHCPMTFSGGLILHTHMRMNGSWHISPGEAWQMSPRASQLTQTPTQMTPIAQTKYLTQMT